MARSDLSNISAGIVFKQDDIKPTVAQYATLIQLGKNWRGVEVSHGAYALPPGYLSIVLDPNGHPVYGGVSPEGDVST